MLEALLGDPAGVDTFVDPRDEMLRFAAEAVGPERARFDYFRLGHELLETVEQVVAWAFQEEEQEGLSVLEFACGYGRNIRHLVRRFPPANVTVSDIDPDAVAF